MDNSSSKNKASSSQTLSGGQERTIEGFGGAYMTPAHMGWLPPRDKYLSNSIYSSSFDSSLSMPSSFGFDFINSLSGSMGQVEITEPHSHSPTTDYGLAQYNDSFYFHPPDQGHSTFQDDECSPGGSRTRHTPNSLGWDADTRFPESYKLCVPKGKPPYLELLPELRGTPEMPKIVYLDDPSVHRKGVYHCMFPGICVGKKDERSSFSRPADLERHYTVVHTDQRVQFPCDKQNCERAKYPFTRKDHYRDHLRDYHKEDLGSAKRGKKDDEKAQQNWVLDQKKWLAERRISSEYWRCAKCLKRICVADDGWKCRGCNLACEPDRILARLKLGGAGTSAAAYHSCQSCDGTGWIEDMNLGLELCECQTASSDEAFYEDNNR